MKAIYILITALMINFALDAGAMSGDRYHKAPKKKTVTRSQTVRPKRRIAQANYADSIRPIKPKVNYHYSKRDERRALGMF